MTFKTQPLLFQKNFRNFFLQQNKRKFVRFLLCKCLLLEIKKKLKFLKPKIKNKCVCFFCKKSNYKNLTYCKTRGNWCVFFSWNCRLLKNKRKMKFVETKSFRKKIRKFTFRFDFTRLEIFFETSCLSFQKQILCKI